MGLVVLLASKLQILLSTLTISHHHHNFLVEFKICDVVCHVKSKVEVTKSCFFYFYICRTKVIKMIVVQFNGLRFLFNFLTVISKVLMKLKVLTAL